MGLVPSLQEVLRLAGIHADMDSFLRLFSLLFARIASAISLTPFFGGNALPAQVRLGLALAITALLYPAIAAYTGTVPASSLVYFALLGKEIVVGTMIGLVAQMVFFGVQTAGIIMDTQRGMDQMTYVAPQLPGNTSSLGNLQIQASVVLFLLLNGHLLFLDSLANSFVAVPPGAMPIMASGLVPVALEFVRISASAILIGAELCSPVVLTVFLVDTTFGSLEKLAPSIQVTYDSETAKSWLGLGVFCLSTAFFFEQLQRFLASLIPTLNHFIRSLQ